jgi:hypothetical protein
LIYLIPLGNFLSVLLRACLVELHLILILHGSWFSERSDSVAERDSL